MNEESYGCFACHDNTTYSPPTFEDGSVVDTWNSLGVIAQGAVVAAAAFLLIAYFFK